MLRQILITDSPAPGGAADVIVWLGHGETPPAAGGVLIAASSRHAAAVFVASEPAVVRVDLDDPVGFLRLVAELRRAPALPALAA